jgi:hypothetical protein
MFKYIIYACLEQNKNISENENFPQLPIFSFFSDCELKHRLTTIRLDKDINAFIEFTEDGTTFHCMGTGSPRFFPSTFTSLGNNGLFLISNHYHGTGLFYTLANLDEMQCTELLGTAFTNFTVNK